ncbi:hypothetical protein OCU04_006457 [Sclerotinia nivalis]|uniref:S-adenosyl-L-methionine-dependent methyltransferase n=1 Tax=Sclerotinia nivalis TaxID=352851 RepID=A0A9X0DK13_9HELO|nr:hypothetical protein OCU04_006457 [Sclerotinia nivalis]
MASATLKEYAMSYFLPFYLYVLTAYQFLLVLFRTLLHNPFHIRPLSNIASQSFGEAWAALDEGDPYSGPLANILPVLSTASGTILEVGPGSGDQVRFLTNENVEMVYGVEPCEVLHGPLEKAVREAGLQGKYKILGCGAERESLSEELRNVGLLKDDKKGGILWEVFDTITVIRVLCSVNNPIDTIDFLYKLLKPGGRLIVCEHVENPWWQGTGSLVARCTQILCQLGGWSFFMGNCHLDRRTDEYLKAAGEQYGGWEKVELKTVGEFAVIPFVFGELVKRR